MHSIKSPQLVEPIRQVILTDFANIMTTTESTMGKFMVIALGIEFLGACLDKQHLNATARSEKRFNSALLRLFPNKYHHFAKTGSVPYLYIDFRCQVIHQFRTAKTVLLCSSDQIEPALHLTYNQEGSLIMVAEEFYQDLAAAAQKLINT
jgi:hypothetical protein